MVGELEVTDSIFFLMMQTIAFSAMVLRSDRLTIVMQITRLYILFWLAWIMHIRINIWLLLHTGETDLLYSARKAGMAIFLHSAQPGEFQKNLLLKAGLRLQT